ncbi:MAG TPA: helix-turn-helix transcriptional regulator [Dongiaceae bacterium]|jgi:transcriptional regulator with XRE-family HTH domain|nr:helix-turn-helix transcriptional regulator [Dongiaceae bacterium]
MTALLEDGGRRRELAQFLKDRRARIAPGVVGVPVGARRRARGLLREEVAMIAGVGVTWYTWLEQARPIKPSVRVLGSIARALRLSDVERTHLFKLARPDLEPAPPAQLATAISYALQRTMDALAPNPAYAVNAVWDVIGWNKPAALIFGDFGRIEAERRNLLYLIFCDPDWKELFREWETISAFAVAQFRESTARLGGDARFKELVRMLEQDSESFRQHWRRRDVHRPIPQSKILDHPRAGRLNLEYSTFQADSDRDVRLTIYTPGDAESARRIVTLTERPLRAVPATRRQIEARP